MAPNRKTSQPSLIHRMTTRSQSKKIKQQHIKNTPLDLLVKTLTKPSKVILERWVPSSEETPKETPKETPEKQHDQRVARIDGTWEEGQIVWAKMRGFPNWPAKITGFPLETNMVDLIFYGDRTYAKMFKNALISFEQGAKNFQPGARILLNKAVKEALVEKRQQMDRETNEK